MVILPEIAHQHAKGLIDVQRPDGNHLLKISPVLRPVEEGLEDGKIGATKKWNLPATKIMNLTTLCRLEVEIGRVQEDVYGRLFPPQPDLSVPFEDHWVFV